MAESTVNVTFAFGGSSGVIPAGARNISMQIGGARGGSGGFDAGGPGGGAGSGRWGTFYSQYHDRPKSFPVRSAGLAL